MGITIVDQPDLRIAGLRHIGPYPEIGREFGRLGGLLQGTPPAGSQMIAVYHDDPDATAPDRLRSDAALTLSVHTPTPMGLVEQHVPAGTYAKTIHNGGYEGLPETWKTLKDWAITNGHRVAHPGYEIYLNNPMTAAKDDLMTEVYLRIE